MQDPQPQIKIENQKVYPSAVGQRCPVCNGFGRLNYGKIICHACNGKGYILIPTQEVKE